MTTASLLELLVQPKHRHPGLQDNLLTRTTSMNKIEGSPDNQTPNQTEERSMTMMMVNKGWADLQS
jgi:hypothetical protein